MGGSNETTIAGLRMHVSGGEVHVHDDSHSLKFSKKVEDFKSEVKDVLDDSQFGSNNPDGIMIIEADKGANLCIGRHNKNVFAFLLGTSSIKSQLDSFIKGC